MIVAGIDPGVTGALAMLDLASGRLVAYADMPTAGRGRTDKQQVDVPRLAKILREASPDFAVIELVSGFNPKGDQKQGTSRAFNFGDSFGCLRCAIEMLEIKHTFVRPQTWKGWFGLIGQDKDASRLHALALWGEKAPLELKKHNGRAEAMLLARWAIQTKAYQ